jgi:hypothetical protein
VRLPTRVGEVVGSQRSHPGPGTATTTPSRTYRHCDEEGARVQQLSWTDDLMLRTEGPSTPMHIQMLLIYDPSTAPGGKVTFKGILDELDGRLHLCAHLPTAANSPTWLSDHAVLGE